MRKFIPYIVTIVLCLICAVAVFAVQFGSFGCDCTITPVNKEVKLYTNSACTETFTPPIHYGEVSQGQVVTFDLYCRNESLVETDLDFIVTAPAGIIISWSPSGLPKLLQPNEVYKITMITTISLTAPLGYQSWNITYTD
jgi:hypothetical protein